MDKNKYKNLTSKTSGATAVELEEGFYLSPNYQSPVFYPNQKGTDTGHIVFGELFPKESSLPHFKFRWDKKAQTVDVDIFLSGKQTMWAGYSGHHPVKLKGEGRKFQIDLKTPKGEAVLNGILSVGLQMELSFYDAIKISEDVNVVLE